MTNVREKKVKQSLCWVELIFLPEHVRALFAWFRLAIEQPKTSTTIKSMAFIFVSPVLSGLSVNALFMHFIDVYSCVKFNNPLRTLSNVAKFKMKWTRKQME